ncbi:DUF7018 domain-containing (lipo)protein [Bacillus cereus group sp. BfR-BA-01383]|uniref:DUF7018 domain-containing (lipo)protein n=1 Tax=Bacillus cereus group sp. BfR-BA-01383 TaxID=2920327 RepID=UPI001F59EDA9|nr:DUF3994 domain-containing protein [Bacillus cereus group sp. BfR-BA-01383]
MRAKKLVTLAVPFMLLVGCGTDKTEAKPKEKVESKEETKEKLSKEKYPLRMTKLSSELVNQITVITEIAMDKDKDEKVLKKEIIKEESELQKIIAKFKQVAPPKEFVDSHKQILKAVDCYSKAYALQVEVINGKGKITEEDRSKSQKSMDLIKEGNEYWQKGYAPLQDAQLDQANELGKKTGVQFDKPSTSSSDDDSVQVSQDGKELLGEWGNYKGSEFHKGLDFREDNSFTAYDDTGKTSYEDNHMTGTWIFDADKKQVTLLPTEFVKDGKKIDAKNTNAFVEYKLEFLRAGSLKMTDGKGNTIEAERRK